LLQAFQVTPRHAHLRGARIVSIGTLTISSATGLLTAIQHDLCVMLRVANRQDWSINRSRSSLSRLPISPCSNRDVSRWEVEHARGGADSDSGEWPGGSSEQPIGGVAKRTNERRTSKPCTFWIARWTRRRRDPTKAVPEAASRRS
jgi:hypothetical protein